MKRNAKIGIPIVCVLAVVLASAWNMQSSQLKRLMRSDSIEDETGLRMPSDARIVAANADTFSLADGNNYMWLIESERPLDAWVNENMTPELGGWENVDRLSDLGHFPGEIPEEVKFGGVWRGVAKNRDGGEETSYLYLAQDGEVAILATFRP